jgi:hypothetical protein
MEIVIRERTLERIAYWIVILLLGVLLLITYLRSPTCQQQTTTNTTPAASPPPANQTQNATATATQNAASCTDGIKNQDETDVDCGGLTCPPCAEGLHCVKNSDCLKAKCTAGICNATVAATTTDISLTDVGFTLSNGTQKIVTAVSSLNLRIQNGNPNAKTFRIDVYVKTFDGQYYLDQGVADPPTTPRITYARIDLPLVPGGQVLQQLFTLTKDQYTSGGKSIIPTKNGEYVLGGDFSVEVRLVDPATETVVATAKKTVTVS